ncbi:MAG TPA: hypothetical protein VMR77_04280 [Patescibacteria group bacterium]|nr:hypothetical protein [Patescibacteria group bacterium]
MPGRGRPRKNPIPAPQIQATTPVAATVVVQAPPKNVLFFIDQTEAGIGRRDIELVEKVLDGKSGDLLYLVLQTYGGDVYSAVKIMRILQFKFKEIKVIIPDFVYSSGTIMALGGDTLYFDVDACIGPLDKPMENPRDGSDISSLDITNTLTNIASTIESIATSFYGSLRVDSKIKLSKIEAAKLAYESAVNIVNPIINKIDPYFLQSGYRQTQIGLRYAVDMLASRMKRNNIKEAVDTALDLVNKYPAHSYGIYREEAKYSLNLETENLETLAEWGTLKVKFDTLKKSSNAIEFMVF